MTSETVTEIMIPKYTLFVKYTDCGFCVAEALWEAFKIFFCRNTKMRLIIIEV